MNSNIIIGVCGSIAVYKSVFLLRLLREAGAFVKVILTDDAQKFVQPLTFSALSENQVFTNFSSGSQQSWNNHVHLAQWADCLVIAPATAHTISKMAYGFCDNLLLATYLSARCPVCVYPAMDSDMIAHTSTKKALSILESYGNFILHGDEGSLASGLVGAGRMAEPEAIVTHLEEVIGDTQNRKSEMLKGKKVIVTASTTYEYIDAIRYIANGSSGKMGFCLAKACLEQGAEVILVTGPSKETLAHHRLTMIRVESAHDMYQAVDTHFRTMDIAIFAAAVSDYSVENIAKGKIKKDTKNKTLTLIPTKDIAKSMGKIKQPHQTIIGFALEEKADLRQAREKMHRKNMDYILLNTISQDMGMGKQLNFVHLVTQNADKPIGPFTKEALSRQILDFIFK